MPTSGRKTWSVRDQSAVRISQPSVVPTTVCSNCAERRRCRAASRKKSALDAAVRSDDANLAARVLNRTAPLHDDVAFAGPRRDLEQRLGPKLARLRFECRSMLSQGSSTRSRWRHRRRPFGVLREEIDLVLGSNDAETIRKLLILDPSAPSVFRPGIPHGVDAIVRRALSRDPATRQTTAEELGEEVEKAARAGGAVALHREVAASMRAASRDSRGHRA